MDFETLFYDILAVINIVFFALVKKTHDISLIIIEKVKSYDYQALGLQIAFYAGQAKQILVETYEKNCKKGDPLDVAKETVVYYINYLHSVVFSYRIEPLENEWISTSCIYQTPFDKATMTYTFNENYEPMNKSDENDNTQSNSVNPLEQFNIWFHAAQNVIKANKNIEECLLTMKSGDKYIYKICNRENKCCDELPNELSKIKFLNIEYNHPENEKSITIDIDKNGYLVGNEILSNTFIKRSIEYMNNRKSFDMSYTVKIMDNNLDSVVILSDEYIVLEKNSYKIMKKTSSQLSNDWVELTTETNEGEMVEVMNEVEKVAETIVEKALEEAVEKVEDIIVKNNDDGEDDHDNASKQE
jgi:hypothetical protein